MKPAIDFVWFKYSIVNFLKGNKDSLIEINLKMQGIKLIATFFFNY